MKTYAFIANGGVLYARESEDSPGADWREVLADEKPTPSESEDVVETGWTITATTAKRTWVLVAKSSGPVMRVSPKVAEVQNWALEEELTDRGLIAGLRAAIQSLPAGPSRAKAEARWAKKPTIRRNDALVGALGQALSLTSTQIDDIFTAASLRT
jgi:hypothetical protein